ncbi:MAG: protein kinase family protein [Rhodospirillaceae bacterium]|nr:protein kinase family protein [Rhodospirillaceae bacterium]
MRKAHPKPPKIKKFDLKPGRIIGGTYEVDTFLGGGFEGEVYKVSEFRTGVPRTAKLYYPHRNENDLDAMNFARKLEMLRDCSIVIQYHHAETLRIRRQAVTCLISEYVDGAILSKYISSHPGKRMPPYKALSLIYALVVGLEEIHWKNEYHGDIHSENILIQPQGIFFDVKLVDFYNLGRSNKERRKEDIIDIIHLLHEAIGGNKWYAKAPQEIKDICRGLRRDLILERFPTARHLREHLETY